MMYFIFRREIGWETTVQVREIIEIILLKLYGSFIVMAYDYNRHITK